MKKINYLGLVGLGCGALLLSGCGASHTLTCEMKTGGQEMTYEIEFNKDETKVESVSVEFVLDLGSEATDEEVEQSKEAIKENCTEYGYKNCKVSAKGKKITYSYESSAAEAGFDAEAKLEDVKSDAEKSGFSCKK